MVKTLPARSIIAAVANAAAAWCEAGFEPRRQALAAVSARTGYAPSAVEFAFDGLFRPLTGDAIETVIAGELGSVEVLDDFVTRGAGYAERARPVGRVCIISSRTTIGVAIVPAIFALCAKCTVLVKDREDHLVAAFFATLAKQSAALGEVAVARPWRGESEVVDLQSFDAVVAFGSDETLSAIAAVLRFPTQLIAHPAKVSAGYVSRTALSSEAAAASAARGAALDMLLYDGEGCLSLRVIFVERGALISPSDFYGMLHAAVEDAGSALPAVTAAAPAARRAIAADLATFRTATSERLFTDAQRSFVLQLDPPGDASPLLLPRVTSIHSVDEPSGALAYLTRHAIPLEALAVAGDAPDLRELAAELGAARVTSFGSLQSPPLRAPHGGRPRIAEFVRWTVDEA